MSSLIDTIFAAFMLMVFGIAVLIGLMVFNSIEGTGLLGTYGASLKGFYTSLNSVAIFIAIGMSLAAVFSGLMIRTHPAFFIIAVILVFIEFLVVHPLGNFEQASVGYGSISCRASFVVLSVGIDVDLLGQPLSDPGRVRRIRGK